MKRFRIDLHKNRDKKSGGTYKSQTEATVRSQPPHCTKHADKRLDMYCKSCQAVVCTRCAKVDHSTERHSLGDLQSQANIITPLVRELLHQANWYYDVIQDLYDVWQDNHVQAKASLDQAITRIKHSAESLPPGSQKSESATLKKVGSVGKIHTSQTVATKDSLDKTMTGITDCRQRLHSITQHGCPYDVITEYPRLEKELKDVLKQEVNLGLWQCDIAPVVKPVTSTSSLHKLSHTQSEKPETTCILHRFQLPVYHGVAGLALHAGYIWAVGYRDDTLGIHTAAGEMKCTMVIDQLHSPQGLLVLPGEVNPSPKDTIAESINTNKKVTNDNVDNNKKITKESPKKKVTSYGKSSNKKVVNDVTSDNKQMANGSVNRSTQPTNAGGSGTKTPFESTHPKIQVATKDSECLATRVVISDHGGRCLHWMTFSRTGDEWAMTSHRRQRLGYRPAGISTCSQHQVAVHILVCDPHHSCLHLYNIHSGKHVSTVTIKDTAIKPYSALAIPQDQPAHMSSNHTTLSDQSTDPSSSHAYVIRDWQQCAFFWVDEGGSVISFYDEMQRPRSGSKFSPTDIVMDGKGRVIATDIAGHTLELYRPDGRFMQKGSHLSKERKLTRPHRVHVEAGSRLLAVAHQPGDQAEVIILDHRLLMGSLWPHKLTKHTVLIDQ